MTGDVLQLDIIIKDAQSVEKGKFLGETEEEMGNKNVDQKRAPFSCGQHTEPGLGQDTNSAHSFSCSSESSLLSPSC